MSWMGDFEVDEEVTGVVVEYMLLYSCVALYDCHLRAAVETA